LFRDYGYKAWGENRQPATKFTHDYHYLLYKDSG
jgi:hypothetical protein